MKYSPSTAALGPYDERSVIAPATRTRAGPEPTRSYAISVPSVEMTLSMSLSFASPDWCLYQRVVQHAAGETSHEM